MRLKSGRQKPRRAEGTRRWDRAPCSATRRGAAWPRARAGLGPHSAQVLALTGGPVASALRAESFGTGSHCRNSTTKATFGFGKINKPSVILVQAWQPLQTCLWLQQLQRRGTQRWDGRGAPACLCRCWKRSAPPCSGTSLQLESDPEK